MSETNQTTPRYRPVPFGVTRVSVREGKPGTRYVQAELPLGAYARRLSDFLVHWAEAEPERTFMARREQLGENALHVVRENLGAVDRTVDMIVNGIKDRGLYVAPSPVQPAAAN